MSPTTEGGGGISGADMSGIGGGGGGITVGGMSPTTEGGGGISGAGMSGIGGGGGGITVGGMSPTTEGGGISGAGMSGIGGGMPPTTEGGGGISEAGIGGCADAGFTEEATTGVMGALLPSTSSIPSSITKESALSSAGLERVRSGAFWSFLKNSVRLCSVTSVLSSPSSALSKSPRQSFRKRCDAIPPERTSLDLESSTPGRLLTRLMLKARSFL